MKLIDRLLDRLADRVAERIRSKPLELHPNMQRVADRQIEAALRELERTFTNQR
jgi:hypothetical protein